MDECTYSSRPGGILPCVCHTTLLCFIPSEKLYVSQPLGARAAGENPCQPPRSGEGLLQQRAMSVCNPSPITAQPHPNTAITQLQARSSRLCQLSSFSVPKLSFSLLTSTDPDGYLRTPSRCQPLCNELFTFVSVIVDFTETAEDVLQAG